MATFQQGDTFSGRYILTQKLGLGGFSEVWKAEDQMTDGTVVAIKIYAPEKGLDDHGLKQFRKEYALTQPLNHSNLLKASYFDITEGSPYLVMQYCSNGSLNGKLMEHGTFSEKDIARVIFQVGGALAYLHSKEILHQDIKPDNVLIDSDGNYLLTDFGISSRMRSTLRKATSTAAALTVAYAPPERFDQNPTNTEASDVFSFGVMLYELCDGDVPWMGSGGITLLSGSMVPSISDKYSKELQQLVKACMERAKELRPTTEQLVESARQFLSTGTWDVSFLKATPEAVEAPSIPSGRKTELLEDVRPVAPVSAPEAAPAAEAPKTPTADPNATRADFGAGATTKKKSPVVAIVAVAAILILAAGGVFGYQYMEQVKLEEQFNGFLTEAKAKESAGDLNAALAEYSSALALMPESADTKTAIEGVKTKIEEQFTALFSEGKTLLESKDNKGAIDKFTAALVIKPEDDSATYYLNNTYYTQLMAEGDALNDQQKDYGAAKGAYAKALEYMPNDEVAKMKMEDAERKEKAIKLAVVNGKLMTAVKANDVAATKAALAEGADANAHDDKDTPALLWAIKVGDLELVKTLVDGGAKCTDKSGVIWNNGATYGSPVVAAAGYNKLDIVKYFIESCKVPVDDQEYDFSTKKNNGWTPLGASANEGNTQVMSYLISKGANINVVQGSGKLTPLHEASMNGKVGAAELLLKKNANTNLKTAANKDAYDLAKSSAMKELLKKHGMGKAKYRDDFNSYSSSYFFDGKEVSDNNKRAWISGGKAYIHIKGDIGYSFYNSFTDLDVNKDWEVEAEITLMNNYDRYGLIFAGVNNEDGYRLLIDPEDGTFAVKRLVNDQWRTIVDYKSASAIKQGYKSNKLKIEKSGNYISIYINGTKVLNKERFTSFMGTAFGLYTQSETTKISSDYFELKGVRR